MADWTLDDTVLESYIERFYGHGGYGAKYWFVGMEFGGGKSVTEIVSRVQGWYDRGGKELEDLGGSDDIGGSEWFGERARLQPTWRQLIRVLLNAEGWGPDNEQIRAYQQEHLGREGGLDCILELLPLPSRGLGHWLFYPDYEKLSYLSDRKTYIDHIAPTRITHLRQRINEHCPGMVIFYGVGFQHYWRAISGVDFKPSNIDKVSVARNRRTRFVMMRHPIHGPGNSYFDAVGRLIADVKHC